MKLELEKMDQERQKWDEKIRLKDDELMKARYNIESLQTKCLGLEKTLQSVESRLEKSNRMSIIITPYILLLCLVMV